MSPLRLTWLVEEFIRAIVPIETIVMINIPMSTSTKEVPASSASLTER
jgi:hypothetical protein